MTDLELMSSENTMKSVGECRVHLGRLWRCEGELGL